MECRSTSAPGERSGRAVYIIIEDVMSYRPSKTSRAIAIGAGCTLDELRRRIRQHVAMAVAAHWLDARTAARIVARSDRTMSIRALHGLADTIPRLSPVRCA